MKHKITLVFLTVWAITGWLFGGERSDGLLFEAKFDSYNVTADYAKGSPKCLSFSSPDLQLRMFPGIDGQNALCLNNDESCVYSMPGNFDPRQGTVSICAAPQNWKPGNDRFQHFFEASMPGFWMLVYKYTWSNYLYFLIQFPAASGTQKIFTASARVEDGDWPAGKWHRLDAAWDAAGMRLYIDGVMPAPTKEPNKAPTNPEIKFPQPMHFPPASPNGTITIGTPEHVRKNPKVNPEDKTAFDEVGIYDRPLSTAEIRESGEKHFPSRFRTLKQPNLLTIPLAQNGITADGVIDSAEWADAAEVPISELMPFNENKTASLPRAAAYLKRDDQNLYAGLLSNQPCQIPLKHKENDGVVWEDDSFELFLESPEGDLYHFIVNSSGAVYDEKNADKNFNAGVTAAASSKKDKWSAELRIPLAALGAPAPGQKWKGNFNLTSWDALRGPSYFGWNSPQEGSSGYSSKNNFGEFHWGTDDRAIRLDSVGKESAGKLDLVLKINRPCYIPELKTDLSVTAENGAQTIFAGNIFTSPWRTDLSAGRQCLSILLKTQNGDDFFRFDKIFRVNFPLDLSHNCRPSQQCIEVKADFNNAGPGILSVIKDKGLSCKAELRRENNVFSEMPFTVASPMTFTRLPLPDDLEPGAYSIKVSAADGKNNLEREISFRVPDMTPYKQKIADNHSVPAPWTPIEKDGDRKFRILDRNYIFGSGPAPVQIISRGEPVISRPPEWFAETDAGAGKVTWTSFKEGKSHDDFAELSGEGFAPGLRFKWQSVLWFNGLYKLDMQMSPSNEKTLIKSFYMTWSAPAASSKFVLSPLLDKWAGDKIEKHFEILQPNANRDFFIWLTGHEKGFLWWPKSPANWANPAGEKQIVIKRDEKNTNVRVNIISMPARLTQTAEYTMSFMGTPSKSPPANLRKFNLDGWGQAKNQSAQILGSGTFEDKHHRDSTTTPVSHIPESWNDYRDVVGNWRKKGAAPLMYSMPAQLSTADPEYDYYFSSWAKTPTYTHKITRNGVSIVCEPCCGHTAIADLMAWRVSELLKNIPDIGGIYYDLSDVRHCENREHGCGGVDAFGKPYLSSIAYNMHMYMLRVYKILHGNNKTLILHAHSLFNPVAHSFADYWWPGEQYYFALAQNPDYFYCENISLEEYQAELSSVTKGVGVIILPQYERSAGGIASLKARKDDFMCNPEWAIRVMTPAALHDINVPGEWISFSTVDKLWGVRDGMNLCKADFHGYWESRAVRSTSPNVLCSWYSWETPSPYSRALVVSNLGREERPAALSIDKKALGTEGEQVKYFDLWNDGDPGAPKELSENDLASAKIKGNHFMLIGVK